jgi:hypothetical protein
VSHSSLILRFRDLVTEPGGTIREHLALLQDRGPVWWGWWMRPQEHAPRELFAELEAQIRVAGGGTEVPAFLFDTGQGLLYPCALADLRVAPEGETIGPPDIETAPTYYQRGRYPAWFRVSLIDTPLSGVPGGWSYESFPTSPEREEHQRLIGQAVASFEQLRNTDATLWVIARP